MVNLSTQFFSTIHHTYKLKKLLLTGHSQTVIGIEILKDGEPLLLIIDPSTRPNQMEKLLSNNTNNLGLIRKSIHNMKSDQYQIATVTGLVTSDEELQVRDLIHLNYNS